ncbi:hypothetical protein ACHAXS_001732 [Conticribra weissflogii]
MGRRKRPSLLVICSRRNSYQAKLAPFFLLAIHIIVYISIIGELNIKYWQVAAQNSEGSGSQAGTCAEEGNCNDETGPATDATIAAAASSTTTVQLHRDGSLTIHSLVYDAESNARHDYEISRHLRRIGSKSSQMQKIDQKMIQMQHEPEVVSQSVYDDLLYRKYEACMFLIEDLLSLALIHKEDWMQSLLHPSASSQLSETNKNNFKMAVNAYEAAMELYQSLWDLGVGDTFKLEEGGHNYSSFSIYDREALSAGLSGVYLQLSDLFHQHYNDVSVQNPDGLGTPYGNPSSIDNDFSTAYRYLILAEEWCGISLTLLDSVTGEEGRADMHASHRSNQHEETHDIVTRTAKETCSFTQLRIGTLLLDMYAVGYTLDSAGNLRLDYSSPIPQYDAFGRNAGGQMTTDEDQRRIVQRALEKLQEGVSMAKSNSPGRNYDEDADLMFATSLNLADAHNHMGVAYGYLFEWTKAAKEWETSMEFYRREFHDPKSRDIYQDLGGMDLVGSIVTTTQSLWEAHLHLGNMKEAKDVFRQHLLYRRYMERGISIEEPLNSSEDEEDAFFDARDDDGSYDFYGDEFESGDSYSDQVRALSKSLESYQSMLEEYLQLLEKHPDGSYYEIGLDDEQSYLSRDDVYEGSLRAGIGSIYLALNQIREARNELVLAVGLLRGAATTTDGAGYEFVGQDGQTISYPIEIDLADALMNLAYAQLALKQFEKSFASFEESMDLYSAVLLNGESPFSKDSDAFSQWSKEDKISSLGENIYRFFSRRGSDDDSDDMPQSKNDSMTQPVIVDAYFGNDNSTENL